MNPLNVVLIGYGRMGSNHFRVLSEDKRFSLKAVVDPALAGFVPSGLKGTPAATSLNTLNWQNVDCAVVAVPTKLHYQIGLDLLKKGINLLVEKPLCCTATECLKLIQTARRKKLKLLVGHVERFNPAVRKLHSVMKSQALGRPIHFSFTRVGGYPFEVDTSNNVLLDLAVHDLDVLNMLSPGMHVVASICHSSWRKGIRDTAEIMLCAANGVSASIHVNWITPTKIRAVRVTGTKGACFVDYILQTCTLWGGNLLTPSEERRTDFHSLVQAYQNSDKIEFGVKKEEPLKLQLDAFYRSLQGQASEICQAEEACLAVELAEQAIKKGGI